MKDVTLADQFLFEIDPKTYLYGADIVTLARTADRAPEKHDVTVMFTSPILEAHTVVDSVEYILVCVPHLDSICPGRGITDIPPEALIGAGVRMAMLNHAEHPITLTVFERTMQRAVEVELATAVCTSSLAEVHMMASLGPDLLIVEPTGLIGTDKPSGLDYVEVSNRAVRKINPGMCILQGAGISTPADVEAVIRNGTNATGSSSTITMTSDPSVMVEAVIRAARRGWDAHPRS